MSLIIIQYWSAMTLAPNLHTFLVLLDVALWFFDASYNNMTFYFPSLTPCMTKLLQPSVPFCVYTLWPCPDKICRHCYYPSPPPAPLWVGSWVFYLMCRHCHPAVGSFFFIDLKTLSTCCSWVFYLICRHCPPAVGGSVVPPPPHRICLSTRLLSPPPS